MEYRVSAPRARRFARYLEGREPLLISAIEVYEVYKVIRRDLPEERAVEAVSALRRATIAPVDESLALEAADVSLAHGLAMADSLVYATARQHVLPRRRIHERVGHREAVRQGHVGRLQRQ